MIKIKILFLLIPFFYNNIIFTVAAQNTAKQEISLSSKRLQIDWVGQIPAVKNDDNISNIAKRIFQFFTGKKKPIFSRPYSLLVQKNNQIYVLDQGRKSVIQINQELGKITQLQDKNSSPYPSLVGICSDKFGRILFTDSKLNKLFYLQNGKKTPQILNDTLRLNRPTGIAYSLKTNEIWVVETLAHRITILNDEGIPIKRIGRRGTLPGEFNFPTFIRIDRFGTVYVIDSMNFRVQIFNHHGEFSRAFGQCGDAPGYFAHPKAIATDSRGIIYIVDSIFHAVQLFDKHGNFLHTFGSQGTDSGKFWLPVGIFIDEKDQIFVADSYNKRIQIFRNTVSDINEK